MLSIVETLMNTLLVIGTSIWGWIGLAAGLGGAFIVWHVLVASEARAPIAALTFVILFMVISWQEIRKK